MVRRISLDNAQRDLAALLNGLRANQDSIILERDGTPVGVIIPPHVYDLMEERDRRDWERIMSVAGRNAHIAPDEIERDIAEELQAMKRERREQEQLTPGSR